MSVRLALFCGVFFLEFFTLQDGADMLSRNVGKGLPFDAA
jgi:hypothetical protein